jgi:hypothetical protein
MWDNAKTPEDLAVERFFEKVSNDVHDLFFPPAENMDVLHERITYVIERQRAREAEANKETAANRCQLIREDPRLRDKAAGPPDGRSKWTWEKLTDHDGVIEGWLHDRLGLAGCLGILDADTPEELLPCRYLEIAMIHDWTDDHFRRARPKLLEGFDLPEEIASLKAMPLDMYCPGGFSTGEERRRKIERALDDVKADLRARNAAARESTGGAGSLPAQARNGAQATPSAAGGQMESSKRPVSKRRSGVNAINTDQRQESRREKLRRKERRSLSQEDAAKVLEKCRRRCCVCFALEGNASQKKGQLAHLDHDRSNNAIDNFVFLCLAHHDTYDSKTSQAKNLTEHEVRSYQAKLHQAVERGEVPRRR